jgi:hypothetical protein
MDEHADTSSEDRPGQHLLDERSATRNRKVVGSNPTSSSKTAAQRLSLDPSYDRPLPLVIPLPWKRRERAAGMIGSAPAASLVMSSALIWPACAPLDVPAARGAARGAALAGRRYGK